MRDTASLVDSEVAQLIEQALDMLDVDVVNCLMWRRLETGKGTFGRQK